MINIEKLLREYTQYLLGNGYLEYHWIIEKPSPVLEFINKKLDNIECIKKEKENNIKIFNKDTSNPDNIKLMDHAKRPLLTQNIRNKAVTEKSGSTPVTANPGRPSGSRVQ